jgi:hypothetical protein
LVHLKLGVTVKTPERSLLVLLRHRIHSVEIGRLALAHSRSWSRTPSIAIHFDGKQVIEGKATAFTNGAIEAAIIHSRALLEFLGLAGNGPTKLRELTGKRKDDDRGVEHYRNLRRLTVAQALRAYPGPASEAEAALAYVIYLANKGLAHTTSTFTRHSRGSWLLDIAFRGVPILMANNFYLPLGKRLPRVRLKGRARGA